MVEKKRVDDIYKRFISAAGVDRDEVSMILRCHLLAEYYIDHILILNLQRGDILLDQKFTFIQKLFIVESLNVLPKDAIDSIKKLNSTRNRCAHDLDYKVTESDIDSIGRPYGKKYLDVKREHFNSIKELLHWTVALPIIDLEIAATSKAA